MLLLTTAYSGYVPTLELEPDYGDVAFREDPFWSTLLTQTISNSQFLANLSQVINMKEDRVDALLALMGDCRALCKGLELRSKALTAVELRQLNDMNHDSYEDLSPKQRTIVAFMAEAAFFLLTLGAKPVPEVLSKPLIFRVVIKVFDDHAEPAHTAAYFTTLEVLHKKLCSINELHGK